MSRRRLRPYIIDVSDRVESQPRFDVREICQCCRMIPRRDEQPRFALYAWSPKRRTRYRLGDICYDCLRRGVREIRKTLRIIAGIQEGNARRLREILDAGLELSPEAQIVEGQGCAQSETSQGSTRSRAVR